MEDIRVPEAIKNLRQWIVWRYEERPGEPKSAKVPYNPNAKHKRKDNWQPVKNDKGFIVPEYSGGAMSNKTNTWGTYEEACKAMDCGIFKGLGIQLYNGLCGIDIDGCIENGEFIGPAKAIMNIMDTYTEYSPSGTGIHLLFYGDIKNNKNLYKKNPNNGVEIYSKGRYFTFTGRYINDKVVDERSQQIEQVQLEYMRKNNNSQSTNVIQKVPMNISDSEIVKIATRAKNGAAFLKLWNGDFSSYNSQSEGDIALCCMLSFYCQADSGRIDSLFRQSGLYRDKWDREDYRNNTINAAVEATSETYSPNYNRNTAYKDFFEDVEDIDKDEKFFLVPKNMANPESDLKVNVSLLTIYMKRKYDIKYYKNQFRIFKNNYYSYVEDMKKVISSEIPESYRIPQNIKDCEELLAMDLELTLNDRDLAPEKYISFRNGVLNVESMQFRSHEDKATKKLIFINQVGYDYNSGATQCKYTDDFFNSITNEKHADIDYLFQILGVLISGYRNFKNIFYFTGKKDTGKSVYMHLAEILLTNTDGTKDFSSIGLKTLTDETSKEFTRIIGKRANLCAETPVLKISNDTLLKQLSGGDSIAAQVKFRESIEFVNNAMLVFSGNTVPNFFVSDKSSISERLLIYEFKQAIPKDKQIKKLEQKMNTQYIIKKAIEQLRLFIEHNQEFVVPEEIYDNQEKMLIDSDTIYKFYKEQLIATEDSRDRISNKDLYSRYIDFLVSEGHLRLNTYDSRPDLSKFKITQYVFTSEMKKYHGEDKYKRKLAYKSLKADCFINLALRDLEHFDDNVFTPLSHDENKIIQGMFK